MADTVRKLCDGGLLTEAVEALGVLVQTDICLSKFLFYAVLKQCVVKRDVVLGSRVHAFSVRKGYESDTFLGNHILRMYASHGRLQEAMNVFEAVAEPDAFMWSSIISAHVKHGQDKQAILLYHRTRGSSVKLDGHVFVAALQACARDGDLKTGQQVHADVLVSGLESDLFVGNGLVNMYAKCGCLEDAQGVFDGLHNKNVVTWNAMIGGYSQQGMGHQALRLYCAMEEEGVIVPNSVTFVCLLQACASVGTSALERGKQLHAQIRQLGHESDRFVANSLLNMYAKCGSLNDAWRVFDGLGQKDVLMWNVLIAGCVHQGRHQDALSLYSAMLEEGVAVPDSVTFVGLLQACASLGTPALGKGKQLHVHIRERGHQGDAFVGSSLVNMYAKCGSIEHALRVFDGLGQKHVVTWTAMISGYAQQGMPQEAFRLYSAMQEQAMSVPDSVTFVCLLQACASLGAQALEKGRQLHSQIRELGHQTDVYVANALVNMYAKCGSLGDAERLFDGLGHKDVVTWTSMIAGYYQQGMGHKALCVYSAMQQEGMAVPDSVTFVCLLQACASVGAPALDKGKQLHGLIRELGREVDEFLANSLVNMYSKCGSLEDARRVFDRLGQKDVATWNAIIAGYSQQGMGQEALLLYSSMQQDSLAVPDTVTFMCLLQTCANVSALHLGRQLHAQIVEQGLQADVCIAGSLIHMYGKCGSTVDAQLVFDALLERDVVTWNALIAGYTCQGDSDVVFALIPRMRDEGTQPNGVTFLSVLTVCSHAGLVSKGWEYFEAMGREYSITPTENHYTCMVDILGRGGQLEEALRLVKSMPTPPSTPVWHILLGACQKWSNVEVATHAFNEALKLDRNDATAYVLMSNTFTSAQMWKQAQNIHAQRKLIRAWKQPGQSWWTDQGGLVHSFLVGDEKHLQGRQGRIRQILPTLNTQESVVHLKSSLTAGNLLSDTEELRPCGHSETLALSYSRRNVLHGSTIVTAKDLRPYTCREWLFQTHAIWMLTVQG